ncbi:DUF4174 domain-containing protein [Mucilaginibacter sp.]
MVQVNSSERILDIYARGFHDPLYMQQMRLLNADPKGLQERDVILRQHFGTYDFKIVLTGKDGGKKYSSGKIVTLAKLYAIIDAMPMRKAEMLNKN